ncbi:MAG: N-formylglutamate amidohydrolase [Alphaproteobacteria bacterium]
MPDGVKSSPPPMFEVLEPDRQIAPFVFNSPHSGSCYPVSFLAATRLDATAVRQSEDVYADRLFAAAVENGAPMLRALFPRAWLDVNREPFELDPRMFDGDLPAFSNMRSARVANGLGTIPRLVAGGKSIYSSAIPVADALARIDDVYVPYHRTLRRLVDRTRETFGFAILIDCHSMPSTVRAGHLRGRPDFVLGDRHGSSCDRTLTDAIEATLVRRGYDVSRNRPYAGGFITEHYGRPSGGVHAIQIEVNRALYLQEQTLEPSNRFGIVEADITAMLVDLIRRSGDIAPMSKDAAE